jgi:hypothetical protein
MTFDHAAAHLASGAHPHDPPPSPVGNRTAGRVAQAAGSSEPAAASKSKKQAGCALLPVALGAGGWGLGVGII